MLLVLLLAKVPQKFCCGNATSSISISGKDETSGEDPDKESK